MDFAKILTFLGLAITLFAPGISMAHDAAACDRRMAPQNPIIQNARADRWLAQRQQIQYLEKKGESFRTLTQAYRSLVQDLFDAEAAERTRVILLVLPGHAILSQIDMTLPAPQFTNELIRLMAQHLTHDGVLRKLRAFADLTQDKLSGY